MRKATRKSYHKQVKYINRCENIIKKQKMARTFLNSDKREFWREIAKIRGSCKGVATTVEGLTEKHDIAEHFSQHYKELFNSVHYDAGEMNGDSVREALKLMKGGKSDGYDGLTSDYLKKMVHSC